MTAPNPADGTTSGSESAGDGTNPGSEGQDTGRAGADLTREALEAELARARADAVKYRQRAREFGDDEQYQRAKDAVAAVEKAEQDKKTEVEKLTEAKEGLLHRASSAEDNLNRLRIALGAGVAPSQVDEFASRLRGSNEEELKADAEKLAVFFTSQQTPPRRGDPSQGAGGDTASTSDGLQAALENAIG